VKNRIYLDHSATTPVDKRVVVTMNEYMLEKFGNPSSIHSFGREAKAALEQAHDSVAALLNCSPDDVFFTSGGTEADNLALIGGAEANRHRGDHVIVSNVEHPAVRNAADELERRGFRITRVSADRWGEVHPEAVATAFTDQTILVSVMHVNNEVGTINDIAAIGKLTRERGVLFHSDAVQSFGKIPLDVRAMNLDLASLSGHKIYGPKGIGALYVRHGVRLNPRFFGGHQEHRIRPGTENLPGIVGLGVAADLCRKEMDAEAARLSQLRDRLYRHQCDELEDITLNGHPTRRLPGNLNISFRGVEGEALLMALDLEGIAVSTGSACSSGSTQPSPVLLAMGLSPEDAQSSIRLTLGRANTEAEIDRTAQVIIAAVRCLRAMSGRLPENSKLITQNS
jgi:cysteine desulfurase